MLTHRTHLPADAPDGTPVAVLLHGRGSDEADLLGLRKLLPEGTALVTPRAPHPGGPWGYGPGWAWYRYVKRDRVVADTLEASLDALDGFVDRLPELLPFAPGALFVGGFSQGGTSSLAWALRRPAGATGILNFSGFLPADDLVDLASAAGLTVFWGHGRGDPNIPFALAEEGRERLRAAGAELTTRDYDIGHWIAPDEMEAAVEWMSAVAAAAADAGS